MRSCFRLGDDSVVGLQRDRSLQMLRDRCRQKGVKAEYRGYIGMWPRARMESTVKYRLRSLRRLVSASLFALGSVAIGLAQISSSATRVWSVGPLTKTEPMAGIALGAGGASISGPHLDSQTESIFAATRSVVFASDRIVIALRSEAQMPNQGNRLLSLDAKTGKIKNSREFVDFGVRAIFATNDAHVVVSGTSVLRLTPDLKDDGRFDYHATGQKYGRVQNASPDGSTLGNATSPGFELINA